MRIAARHHPNAVDGRHLLRLRIELAHSIVLSGRRPITFHPISGAKKLVIGASDFVGSHGTRQLVDRRRRRAGKAERELGWPPEQFHDSIRRAARFYLANR
jgi:hypothetical protein